MLSKIALTSEFWMGLFVTVLHYLTSVGALPQTVLGINIETVVVSGLTYILGRIFGKTARAYLTSKV
jgi:hypothetical protein